MSVIILFIVFFKLIVFYILVHLKFEIILHKKYFP